MGGAGGDGEAGVPGRLAVRVDAALAADAALVLDLVEEGRADLVAVPAHPEQRLVHVGVGVDEAWKEQLVVSIDDRGIGGNRESGTDGVDCAIDDQNIDRVAMERSDVREEK